MLVVGDVVEDTIGPKSVRAGVEEIADAGILLLQPIGAAPIRVQVDPPDWSSVLIEHVEVLSGEQQEEAESVFGPADEVQLKQFFKVREWENRTNKPRWRAACKSRS